MVSVIRLLLHSLLPAAVFATTAASSSTDSTINDLRIVLKHFPTNDIPYILRSEGQPRLENGVFVFDEPVLEVLQSTDPSLANRLVSMLPVADTTAKLDLLRRQDSGNTTATTITDETTVTTATTTPSSSKRPPRTTVVETSSVEPTSSRRRTKTFVPDASVTSTSIVSVPPSTTRVRGSNSDSTSFSFSSSESTSNRRTRTRPTATSTSSDDDDSSNTTEDSAPPKVTSRTVLKTTTLPNGDSSTVTSVDVITPSASSTGTEEEPSLQTGGGQAGRQRAGGEVVALVVGAIGVACFV